MERKMNTRREFLKGAGAFSAGTALAGCLSQSAAKPVQSNSKFIWGSLLHLGSNMWRDWVPGVKYPSSLEEEKKLIQEGKLKFTASRLYCVRDYMSADMKVWRGQVDNTRAEGLNTVFIDIGEAYAFPSHPELWVKGSLDFDEMRAELDYIRKQGLEPVPKLNFSTGHDQWLKEYHYMTSSPKYRQVVADVIRDVCEVFGSPRLFHIGFDEEVFAACGTRELCVMRSGDLWWKDMLFCVQEVERHGARATLWSDKICGGREEFFKKMPKSVLQSPWYYGKDFSEKKLVWRPEFEKSQTWDVQANLASAIVELANAGYDLMPCTSNWSTDEAADAMLGFCKKRIDPARIKGYYTAPWRKAVVEDDAKTRDGIRLFADAKRKYFG